MAQLGNDKRDTDASTLQNPRFFFLLGWKKGDSKPPGSIPPPKPTENAVKKMGDASGCLKGDETTQSFLGIISEAINWGSLINQPGFHGSCHVRVMLPLLKWWETPFFYLRCHMLKHDLFLGVLGSEVLKDSFCHLRIFLECCQNQSSHCWSDQWTFKCHRNWAAYPPSLFEIVINQHRLWFLYGYGHWLPKRGEFVGICDSINLTRG